MYIVTKTTIIDGEIESSIIKASSNLEECESLLIDETEKCVDDICEWYANECGETNVTNRIEEFIEKRSFSEWGYITHTDIILKKEEVFNAYHFKILKV